MDSAPTGSSRTPRTCALVTFGCKVNQVETQVLRERLLARGLREVAPRDGPDLLVVNTCTVTARGGATSRRFARSYAARHPETKVVVTGCHADSDPEDYDGTAVHLVAGNALKGSLTSRLGLGEDDPVPFHEATVRGAGGRTRATVKVQDGCHLRCSYCIIPAVRPTLLSKNADTVVREVRGLVEAGRREVVLAGIHLGAYGRDRRESDALASLVARLLAETEIPRLRLSSIEVGEVSPRLLDLYADHPDRLAPHMHVPLQSGSDEVLRRMRRRYRVEGYRRLVADLRAAAPAPAITTDVIVGFPGETESEFEETVRLCEETAYPKIHVFPYSDRPGTRASSLPGKVPEPAIRERVARLEEVGGISGRAFRRSFLHRTVPVLVEQRRREDGRLTGLTDRYVRVDLHGEDGLMNEIVRVRIESLGEDRAFGRPAT